MEIRIGTYRKDYNITCELPLIIPMREIHQFVSAVEKAYQTLDETPLIGDDDAYMITIGYTPEERKVDPGIRINAEKLVLFLRYVKESGMPSDIAKTSVCYLANYIICNTGKYQEWIKHIGNIHHVSELSDYWMTKVKDGIFSYRNVAIPRKKNDERAVMGSRELGCKWLYGEGGCEYSSLHQFVTNAHYRFYRSPMYGWRRQWVQFPRAGIHPVIKQAYEDKYRIQPKQLPERLDDYINALLMLTALTPEGKIKDEDEKEVAADIWAAIENMFELFHEDHAYAIECIDSTINDYLDTIKHYPHSIWR